MKKILTLFAAACLLAGCGGSAKPEVVKCSGEMAGMQAVVELTFLEEKLTDLGMEMTLEAPSEEMAKEVVKVKDELKEEMGVEGVSEFDVTNSGKVVTIKVGMSVEEAKKLDAFSGTDFNETKEQIIKDMEDEGLKCK